MMPDCPDMALPMHVMQHVMRVESSFNPYAIGVVGGRLERQPRNLPEAVATARMLEKNGFKPLPTWPDAVHRYLEALKADGFFD